MNKKILSILLSAVVVLTATGCNRSEPEDDTSSALINVDNDNLNYAEHETLDEESSSGGSLVDRPAVSGNTSSSATEKEPPTHPNTTSDRPTSGTVYNTTIKETNEDKSLPSIFGSFDLVTRDQGSKTTDDDGITTETFSMFGRTFAPQSYGAYRGSIAVFKGCSPATGKFSISVERNAKNKNAFEFVGLGHRIPLSTTGEEDETLPAEFYMEIEQNGEILDYSAAQLKRLGTETYNISLKAIAVKLDLEQIENFSFDYSAVYDVDTDIYFYATPNGEKEKIQLGMSYEALTEILGDGEELIEELLNDDGELVKTNYYYAYKSGGYVLVVQKGTATDTSNPNFIEIPEDATEEEISQLLEENEKLLEEGVPRDIITAIILIKEEPTDPTLQ